MFTINAKHKKRMIIIVALLLGITTAVALTLYALSQNINLFFTPSEIAENHAPKGQVIRIGGMVVPGSIVRSEKDLSLTFALTDGQRQITVHYTGILPDLFREDQGIVALGKIQDDNTFLAQEVLAKHDENYMPPEVMESLKRAHENPA